MRALRLLAAAESGAFPILASFRIILYLLLSLAAQEIEGRKKRLHKIGATFQSARHQ
jgi:hypothetical protein